jgi:hypothetical protein
MSHTEMLRKRLLLGASTLLLTGSAAWADGSGYVDCGSHPEETQVYAKARRTTDVVASVSCGEGFTVLLNGFIFSRIQTSDGRVGYIFSNLITSGRAPGSAQARRAAPAATPAASANGGQPEVQASAERVKPTQVEAAPASMREAIRAPKPAAGSSRAATTAESAATGSTSAAAAIPAADRAALEAKAEAALSLPSSAQVMAAVNTPATSETAPAGVSTAPNAATSSEATTSAPAASSAPSVPSDVTATPTEAVPATAQPADASGQPQPEAAAEPVKPVEPVRPNERWERPNAGGRRTQPLVDFYGGYAFLRAVNPGTNTNLNGFMGAAAWNVKPWLQLIADSSYNVTTISGVKNVLYGNHWGPRIFIQGFGLRGHRGPGRWGITPFAEALVGGSRADTSVSGATAYSTSDNSFSMKLGGGLDVHQSRHIEIRLIDVDYYRTGFGGLHQNNYWATAGIVIRLFGGGDE